MKTFVAIAISCMICATQSAEVRLLDLEPNDAAQYLNKQSASVNYAPLVESNRPGVRFIGDHPEQVVEDIYLANQYHGQDGLGAYVYGYSIPEIAKHEKKERTGQLQGNYKYLINNGKEIKVQYWDNGEGFHQEDNLAEVLPQQVEDSPDVKAAKETFFRIWNEQAQLNSQAPADPNEQEYASSSNQQNQYQAPLNQANGNQQSQPQAPAPGAVQNQHQPAPQAGVVQQPQQQQPQASASNQQSQYQSPAQQQEHAGAASDQQSRYQSPHEQAEEQGPPKGFFYSFDYPVGVIVGREDSNLKAFAGRSNVENTYDQHKKLYERQIQGLAPVPSNGASSYHVQA